MSAANPWTSFDLQGGQTSPKSVVLEHGGRYDHSYHAVSGELVHIGAVALHDHGRTVDQLGHDLAEPFRTDHRCNAHRVHHVCEEHRDLFVLACVSPAATGEPQP
jgi:hypothetical protein